MATNQQPQKNWIESLLSHWIEIILLAYFLHAIFSCTPKPKATALPSLSVPVDTVRQQLELNIEGSNNTVIISQGKADTAVTDYENAKSRYNKLPLALP